MLKRKPPNYYCQMLPWYVGEYIPRRNITDFEPAREILMRNDDKMVVKKQFDRIYKMMEVDSYTKCEKNPENKEIVTYGFKQTQKSRQMYDSRM